MNTEQQMRGLLRAWCALQVDRELATMLSEIKLRVIAAQECDAAIAKAAARPPATRPRSRKASKPKKRKG
jgi:hypothetical protein